MEQKHGLITITQTAEARIYKGPKHVIDRMKWERFGEAKKKIVCWGYSDEVELEFTHPELLGRKKELDSGVYIIMAQQLNWSAADIMQLRQSENEKEAFYQLYKKKAAAQELELQAKYAPQIAAINARYEASMAKIREMYPEPEPKIKQTTQAVAEPSPEAAKAAAPQGALGIRGRFTAKIAERKQKEDDKSATPASSGVGLAARMRQMKQDKQENEQDSTLFVSNISEEKDESDLRAILSEKFAVRRVNFVRKDKESQCHNGVGFVVLATKEEAERCLEFLNGYRLHHLVLSAAFSKPRAREE
jgi:hypothetical protein